MAHSVLAIGVESVSEQFLIEKGFHVDHVEPCSLEELHPLLEAKQHDAVLFGSMARLGPTAVSEIRASKKSVPIIQLLKERPGESWPERSALFYDEGGDRVIRHPEHPAVVASTVAAVLRRMTFAAERNRHQFQSDTATLEIDIDGARVFVDHQRITLTGHEYEVLFMLARNVRCVTRAEFNESLYGIEETLTNVVEVLISRIRRKLGLANSLLVTRPKEGYELVGRV